MYAATIGVSVNWLTVRPETNPRPCNRRLLEYGRNLDKASASCNKLSPIDSGAAISPSGSDGNVFATAVAERQGRLAE